jgi:hypothetical protein
MFAPDLHQGPHPRPAGTVPPPPPRSEWEGTLPPPPRRSAGSGQPLRSEWDSMPPPPPRSYRIDAPPRAPRAGAPAGIFSRMTAYWRRSSPRGKLVIILVAFALIAAMAAALHPGGSGFGPADEAVFTNQCLSAGYSQSQCTCARNNVEQLLTPSEFHEAIYTTAYESAFNEAERTCGM